MRTLMSEQAWVHYGQIYVQSGEDYPDLAECFGGQRNGLCGAAMPGVLFLQLWPAPPEPDAVVKQTSGTAAYWHGFASDLPPPPTPEEKAAAERRAQAERERAAEHRRLEREKERWGGRLPSQRLRDLGGMALTVAELDSSLVHALDEADPVTQRAVARWVTRRAYAEAQLTEIDWIAAALDAMDRGEPLPSPFDGDNKQAWDRLFSDERVPTTLITSLDGAHSNVLQQAMAFPALFAAREQDPLDAAVGALWNAVVAFGRGRPPMLFAEVRQAFSVLDSASS